MPATTSPLLKTVPRYHHYDQSRHHRKRRLDGRGADNDTKSVIEFNDGGDSAFVAAAAAAAAAASAAAERGPDRVPAAAEGALPPPPRPSSSPPCSFNSAEKETVLEVPVVVEAPQGLDFCLFFLFKLQVSLPLQHDAFGPKLQAFKMA